MQSYNLKIKQLKRCSDNASINHDEQDIMIGNLTFVACKIYTDIWHVSLGLNNLLNFSC